MWMVVCGVWFVVCGLWFEVCGLWFVVCGLWFGVCGLWFVFEGSIVAAERLLHLVCLQRLALAQVDNGL